MAGGDDQRPADGPAVGPFSLALRGITKSFGGVHALSGVDLHVTAGHLHAIAGENGAGKSTLVKLIMGVIQPDAGELMVNGGKVVVPNPLAARRLGFAAVHQEALGYPQLSALENLFIASPLRTRTGGLDWAAMRKAASPVLVSLGGDPMMLERQMGDLRLGHQQLVLLTQALLQDARLIIFDEPTAILSAAETDHLFGIIASLREQGKAMIYISHRVEELSRIADDVTVLTDGSVVGRLEKDEIVPENVVSMMTRGRSRVYRARVGGARSGASAGEVALEVVGLSKKGMYEDVSFTLHRGEVLCVYGQVGAGRSEMALGVVGGMRPDGGAVSLEGRPVRARSPWQAMRSGIGYLPEDRKSQGIFATQSVTWNATSAVFPRYSGALYNVAQSKLLGVAKQYRDKLSIRVSSFRDAIVSLSGGGQQKVVLGRWLAAHLKVLILDEPTRGIDVGTKSEIHDLVRQVARDGLAVLLISSDLPEVLEVADRVMVMRTGRVVGRFDDLQEVVPEDLVSAAVGSLPAGRAG